MGFVKGLRGNLNALIGCMRKLSYSDKQRRTIRNRASKQYNKTWYNERVINMMVKGLRSL